MNEIIGFPEAGAGAPHFDFSRRLQQARAAEMARILDIAGRVALRFGPAVAVGFLFYEILGRPPDAPERARNEERLRRSPSDVAVIAQQLLTLRDTRNEPS